MDVKEEAFVCPFCGAPYRELIPTGVVQVKCKYCQATVLVPPRLGGVVQRCPNHPEVLGVGLCNDCDKSYCDRCLYIHKVRDGKLYVCFKCYKSRQSIKIVGAILLSIFGLFLALLIMTKFPQFMPTLPVGFIVFLFIFFLAICLLVIFNATRKPLSIHDTKLEEKMA